MRFVAFAYIVSTLLNLYLFLGKMIHYWDCADAPFLNQTRAFYSLETTDLGKDLRAGFVF